MTERPRPVPVSAGRRRARLAGLRRGGVIALSGVVMCVAWAAALPGHEVTPNWFYPVVWRGLSPAVWSVPLLVGAAGLVVLAIRQASAVRALGGLVVASFLAQIGSLGLVGPGLSTALARFEGGHGTFLAAAHTHAAAWWSTLVQYGRLAQDGALGPFAPSKPPGTLAYYFAVDAVGSLDPRGVLLGPMVRAAEARPALRAFAQSAAAGVWVFPVTTALSVLAVAALGASTTGRARTGVMAAALWATCPAVLVVSHHTDGALFPALAATACALATFAARQTVEGRALRGVGLGLAAGLVVALSVWCSFGLLPVVGLALAGQTAAGVGLSRGTTLRARAGASVAPMVALMLGSRRGSRDSSRRGCFATRSRRTGSRSFTTTSGSSGSSAGASDSRAASNSGRGRGPPCWSGWASRGRGRCGTSGPGAGLRGRSERWPWSRCTSSSCSRRGRTNPPGSGSSRCRSSRPSSRRISSVRGAAPASWWR